MGLICHWPPREFEVGSTGVACGSSDRPGRLLADTGRSDCHSRHRYRFLGFLADFSQLSISSEHEPQLLARNGRFGLMSLALLLPDARARQVIRSPPALTFQPTQTSRGQLNMSCRFVRLARTAQADDAS